MDHANQMNGASDRKREKKKDDSCCATFILDSLQNAVSCEILKWCIKYQIHPNGLSYNKISLLFLCCCCCYLFHSFNCCRWCFVPIVIVVVVLERTGVATNCGLACGISRISNRRGGSENEKRKRNKAMTTTEHKTQST